MVEIERVVRTREFEKNVKSVKDKQLLEIAKRQINKIINNPNVGKPLRYNLKGERTIYVKPYRLTYAVEGDKLYLLKFKHRKHVYK